MAFALEVLGDSLNNRISLANELTLTSDFEVLVDFEVLASSAPDSAGILTQGAGFSHAVTILSFTSSTVRFEVNTIRHDFTTNTPLQKGVRYKWICERKSGVVDIKDAYTGESIGGTPPTITGNFLIQRYGEVSSGGSQHDSRLYRLNIKDQTNEIIHDWNPAISSGTGLVLEDSVGTEDFTLTGYTQTPTDSWWISLISLVPDADTFYGDTLNYTTALTGLTSATLTDSAGNVLNLTSVTDTSASVPAIVAGLNGILIENDVTLTVSDGTDTTIATLDFLPPTGYTLTTLSSIVDRDLIESDWIFGFDTPAAVGDQSLENSAIATHNADGSASFTEDGTYTYFTIDATDGTVSEITKTIEAESTSPTIPVGSRGTWNKVGSYLRSEGSSGSNNDVIMAWLGEQGFEGSFDDRVSAFLKGEGHSGSTPDMLSKWKKS